MTSKRVTVKSPILYKSVSGNVGLKIQGKTEQKTYTGKNLFSMRKSNIESNGISVTVDNENQSFSASGTATNSINIALYDNYNEIKDKISNGGTFTFSFVNANFDKVYSNVTVAYGYGGRTNYINADGVPVTVPSGSSLYNVSLYVPSGKTVNLTNVKIQLEENDVATEWERYVGGTPSPNTNYPQEIKRVVLNTIKTRTKNILKRFTDTTLNGVDFSVDEKGIVTMNGISTAGIWCGVTLDSSYYTDGDILYVSGCDYSEDKGYCQIEMTSNGTINYSGFKNGEEIKIKVLPNTTKIRYVIYIKTGITLSNVKVYPMISKEGGEYEPYQETEITLTNPIELNGLNGVYDIATFESVTRRFAKVVFDGSEDEAWVIDKGTDYCRYIINLPNPIAGSESVRLGNFVCTHGLYSMFGADTGCAFFYKTSTTNNFYIYANDITSLNDWKTFLQSNPMTIVYELATPTTEELPTELKNIKSFDGTTHIEIDCEIDTTIYYDYLRKVNIVGKICLGDKEVPALAFGDKKAVLACLGDKEVWIDIAPECVAFSADVTLSDGYSYINGFSESNRFVDDTLLSEVAAPINNVVWCKTDTTQSNTVTKKAYVPSAKALKKYKYAVVTIKSSIAYHNGTNTGIFGNITLPKLPADNTIAYNTNTYKVELNDNTNIQSICNAIKGQTNWATACNIAIEKIVLTNSEE